MTNLIRRAARRLSLLFGPGTGTRRAGANTTRHPSPALSPAAVRRPPTRCSRPTLPPHHSPYCRHLPLDGTENRLVRPYLAAHESDHTHERDRQAHRRLALVLAADFGIDLDQHLIGTGKVAV